MYNCWKCTEYRLAASKNPTHLFLWPSWRMFSGARTIFQKMFVLVMARLGIPPPWELPHCSSALPTSSDLQCMCHLMFLPLIPFPVAPEDEIRCIEIVVPTYPMYIKFPIWLTLINPEIESVNKLRKTQEHPCRRLHQLDGEVYWCRCPAFCHWDFSNCEQKRTFSNLTF